MTTAVGPHDAQRLEARLSELVEAQLNDGKKRANDRYWSSEGHNVGNDVIAAASLAKRAFRAVAANESLASYAAAMLEALADSKLSFSRSYDDPDGFGAATFHELGRDLFAEAQALGATLKSNPYEIRIERGGRGDIDPHGAAPPDAYELSRQLVGSATGVRTAFAAGDYRLGFDYAQIHLLQLGYRLFCHMNEFDEAEILVFRSSVSRVRSWLITALVTGRFNKLECGYAYRSIAAAGGLLSFVAGVRQKGSDATHDGLPFVALEADPNNPQHQLASHALGWLDAALSPQARHFLHSMFADPRDVIAQKGGCTSLLHFVVTEKQQAGAVFDAISEPVPTLGGLWCFWSQIENYAWSQPTTAVIALGAPADITKAAMTLYHGVNHAVRMGKDTSGGDLESARRWLSQALIRPLQDYARLLETLLIIPEDALGMVPFAALLDSEGRALAETHTIVCATALRSHAAQGNSDASGCVGHGLVLGGPEFAAAAESRIRSLPKSKFECEQVAALMHTDAVTGRQATVAAFLSAAPAAKFIHLATHGEVLYSVDPVDPRERLDQFHDAGELFAMFRRALRGSRFALAEADPEHETGYVLTDAVTGLDLRKAHFVFLSLCMGSSGMGASGEGLLGLARAFLAAGALKVVSSLTAVQDHIASTLALRFYVALRDGLGPATALAAAQRSVAEDGVDWFHWSGYQLHT